MLLGSVLLIATAVSFPMYKSAAYDRILQDEFENSIVEENDWVPKNSMTVISKKDPEGSTIKRMEKFSREIYDKLGVTRKESMDYYSLAKTEASSLMKRDDGEKLEIRLGCLKGIEDHAQLLSGEMYSESGIADDGSIEVVVSETAMVNMNLLVGESVEFKGLRLQNGDGVRIKVVGVFGMADRSDIYWQVTPDEMEGVVLMKPELFSEYFTGENASHYTISCTYFAMFDYTKVRATEVKALMKNTKYLLDKSAYRSTMSTPKYLEVLKTYDRKHRRIDSTLFILQVPVLLLLCAFLIMISKQMYEMEKNEISVLKSRGASGGQILRLYLYQSILFSIVGGVLGTPLGALFCKLLGSADNFLQFDFTRQLVISYTPAVALYGLGAAFVSIVIMTVPAIKHSRTTIVGLKRANVATKKSLWEKCFMDIIFLVVAIYGFRNYSSNMDAMTERIMQGKALDPLLYVSSTLYILGCGLLFLRIQPLVIKLINWIGRKHWRPAAYASFMELIKNGRKQQFIMLFLILTISLGMFNATVARTILQNARENQQYLDGADYVMQEVWSDNSLFMQADKSIEFQYYEPDYSKYATLDGARSYTKVVYDEKGYIPQGGNVNQPTTIMGIHTREFGENTWVEDSLLAEPYYAYLNELAENADGVLLSRNFQKDLDYEVGKEVTLCSKDGQKYSGKVIGFFDYWPGYADKQNTLDENGELKVIPEYLAVANIASVQKSWGLTPYQIWISSKPDADKGYFYNWVKENNIKLKFFRDREENIRKVSEDPLLQGTNGILTMSFIVTILLCAVGYLIYWIMSIRTREMMFGVLRAMGMHKREIFHMLILEQIFSGVVSILAGVVIGKTSSDMYIPMLQKAYAATEQILPMKLITSMADMIRLYGVTALAMGLCLGVLTFLVFKLNVARALKLGEE